MGSHCPSHKWGAGGRIWYGALSLPVPPDPFAPDSRGQSKEPLDSVNTQGAKGPQHCTGSAWSFWPL